MSAPLRVSLRGTLCIEFIEFTAGRVDEVATAAFVRRVLKDTTGRYVVFVEGGALVLSHSADSTSSPSNREADGTRDTGHSSRS